MSYTEELLVDLQSELVRLFTEVLVVANRNKDLARDRAVRLNGVRKASDDYDYERARTLVSLLEKGMRKAGEAQDGMSSADYVNGVLEAIRDPLEGLSYPYAVIEEIRFAYSQGVNELRLKLYDRHHHSAELIRNPPKKPLPAEFLEHFDLTFEEFLGSKLEKEKDLRSSERQTEARNLAARVKAVAQHYGNLTDVLDWIEKERTQAGSLCSQLIRDRDPDGRYDPDLEEEYDQASRRSGTVALLASFLNAAK